MSNIADQILCHSYTENLRKGFRQTTSLRAPRNSSLKSNASCPKSPISKLTISYLPTLLLQTFSMTAAAEHYSETFSWLHDPTTEVESSLMQVISKDDRLHLLASDEGKIFAMFVKVIYKKLKDSSYIAGLNGVSAVENIMWFVQFQRAHIFFLYPICLSHPSLWLAWQLIDPDTNSAKRTNFLSANILTPLINVWNFILFNEMGSSFHQENLIWSYKPSEDPVTEICKQTSPQVCSKFMENCRLYCYNLLVYEMINADPNAVWAITQRLAAVKSLTKRANQSWGLQKSSIWP